MTRHRSFVVTSQLSIHSLCSSIISQIFAFIFYYLSITIQPPNKHVFDVSPFIQTRYNDMNLTSTLLLEQCYYRISTITVFKRQCR